MKLTNRNIQRKLQRISSNEHSLLIIRGYPGHGRELEGSTNLKAIEIWMKSISKVFYSFLHFRPNTTNKKFTEFTTNSFMGRFIHFHKWSVLASRPIDRIFLEFRNHYIWFARHVKSTFPAFITDLIELIGDILRIDFFHRVNEELLSIYIRLSMRSFFSCNCSSA